MDGSVISAAGLSKRYPGSAGSGPRWIDAVSDVSFELGRGEAVGLIGRNGAGKSTLLRILSRVTRPSAGRAEIDGTVGALLDVGTGFHPELTGRENTFLSGAILGLSRRDVAARFAAIVEFAEIAPFIDMPVKHYSSGMYARLGFAVAAHLLPNVLIVDEVLAVGDLAFQAKCLAHMHRLTSDGTSILFVSHNLLAVADLCSRTLVMDGGRLVFDGPVDQGIGAYRRSVTVKIAAEAMEGRPEHRLLIDGEPVGDAIEKEPNDPLRVELGVHEPTDGPSRAVVLNLVIDAADGSRVVHLRSDVAGAELKLRPGGNVLTVDVDDLGLAPGEYSVWMRVTSLGDAAPTIWDTEPIALRVRGDPRLAAVAQPRHRFGQRARSA